MLCLKTKLQLRYRMSMSCTYLTSRKGMQIMMKMTRPTIRSTRQIRPIQILLQLQEHWNSEPAVLTGSCADNENLLVN